MKRALAEQLNRDCQCITIDRAALTQALARAQAAHIMEFIEARAHLVAETPVFLAREDIDAMRAVVAAAEAAMSLDGYRQAALAHAPAIAHIDHGPQGAFAGYDFHLAADGPKLIEINTNAGGAFLNAYLARTQRACCVEAVSAALAEDFDEAVLAMFAREWRLQRGEGGPKRIAIVDDAPEAQYLYPEFLLTQRLLAQLGAEVVIADAAALEFSHGALTYAGAAIDLVYNRLVDFSLEAPAHKALRQAYESGAVVVTPNPRNHALMADKRNLVLLSDRHRLARWGLGAEHVARLAAASEAVEVSAANAEALWATRKNYFFKPAAGYGGKAVYRGDKLTRNAWALVRAGGYIAHAFAPPSERMVQLGAERKACKLDVRLYTYAGAPLLAAARLYQGQTTNFRTPGGGFAPVLTL